jgi:hypothetical protein
MPMNLKVGKRVAHGSLWLKPFSLNIRIYFDIYLMCTSHKHRFIRPAAIQRRKAMAVTVQKLQANGKNALKSTGPKTPKRKAWVASLS